MPVTFERTVQEIHQIEISSHCSLRCKYCPSPAIVAGKFPDRTAGHMTPQTFARTLEWVSHYIKQGTQRELNLAGIGESTLNPDLVSFVRLAREVVGPNGRIVFATNGTHMTDELAAALAPYKPRITVSLHRPEVAKPAMKHLQKYGLLEGVSADPTINANSWAGQVDWPDDGNRFPCPWAWNGWLFVMSDGQFSRCCLDASGKGVMGHVNDPIGSIMWSPWDLCKNCYQDLPAVKDENGRTWSQKEGAFK